MRKHTCYRLAALSICFSTAIMNSTLAFADTAQQLLRGTSDAIAGNLDIQVLVNDDYVATAFQAVSATKTQQLELTDLSKGVVLLNYQGIDVATLKSTDFDPAHGGTLQITYLRNALNHSYRTLTIDLVREGDAWQLLANDQSGHHVVTRGFFKAYKVFGQVVGIDSITLQP
jgi:hypothetical protein